MIMDGTSNHEDLVLSLDGAPVFEIEESKAIVEGTDWSLNFAMHHAQPCVVICLDCQFFSN